MSKMIVIGGVIAMGFLGGMFGAPAMAKGDMELTRNGQTQYAIIKSTNSTPAEKWAVEELSAYLQKVTGARFEVMSETNASLPPSAIYVGWTDFARGKGMDGSTLGDEEWIIKSTGKSLVLTGGRPRGTLYAVYEFLEQEVGCHWLDEFTEVVPSKPELKLNKLDIKGQPLFWDRKIYTGIYTMIDKKLIRLYNARNKDTARTSAQHGFGVRFGSPYQCHTFYLYSKDWPTNHPEYLAMNDTGERVISTSGSGPGQICLTNPEVRKLLLEKLRQFIIKDRAGAAKAGSPPPRIYCVEPNDAHWSCRCPECKAFSEREGSDSGPLVDLVNYLADGVRDEFPDVLIDTFAYGNTLKPPKTVRPRDNVIMRLAQLNAEWAFINKLDEYPDMFRPMTNAINRSCHENLVNWSKIARYLSIWDYWIHYSPKDKFATPYINISVIKSDLELFLDQKVEVMFVECEASETSPFWALKRWVGLKLMQNPRQPLDPLLKTFMSGYYGPAAEKMNAYLAYMEKRISAVPETEKLSAMQERDRPYLDLDFYITSMKLLDEAEAICGTNKAALLHVQRERIPVDSGLFGMFDHLQKKLPAGQAMPFDRATVLKRYETTRLAQIEAFFAKEKQEAGKKRLEKAIMKFKEMPLIEKRMAEKPPELQVVKFKESAGGDLSKVDWDQAAVIEKWKTLTGEERPERKLAGRLAHDDRFLYIQLVEETDTSKLKPEFWYGDNWELFFAAERGKAPYNQMAINPKGEHADYTWQKGGGKSGAWKNGAVIKSEADGKVWKISLALPLDRILPGGVNPGRKLYAFFYRSTPKPGEHMAWSPNFDGSFHHPLSRMGELTLE